MPYITEELYAGFYKDGADDRLITGQWPEYGAEYSNDAAKSEMEWVQTIVGEIRSVRADMNVPAGAKIALLVKGASDQTQARINAHKKVICKMARLSDISLTDDIPSGAVQTIVEEATLILPIADIIDLDEERKRLAKVIGKLDQDIQKIDAKLGNEKFVQNAPQEVIDEQKSRKADALAKRSKLEQAVKQLQST